MMAYNLVADPQTKARTADPLVVKKGSKILERVSVDISDPVSAISPNLFLVGRIGHLEDVVCPAQYGKKSGRLSE
jgi:hypothetical protein